MATFTQQTNLIMKRTFVIILALQTLLMLMFLVYALVQRTVAIKTQEVAKKTMENYVESEQKLQITRDQLVECNSAAEGSK
jgi:uncharacterized protein YpmS